MLGKSVSHYRIVDKLGAGGMGEVYAAEDLHLARTVAIKFPLLTGTEPDAAARFLTEARAASRLDHPNIARVYDYGEAPDGRPFLVMELVRGTTLSQELRTGPLSSSMTIGIVENVLRALANAHGHGLVHRDIKPANVMLTESGAVKVLDFGLAKPILDDPTGGYSDAETRAVDPNETVFGTVRGTPEYMSPEQARGLRLDARSDLFSTGVVLYECLTGRSPFSRSSSAGTLDAVRRAEVSPPSLVEPGISRALGAIVMKALAVEPSQRYQRADDMLDDLAAAQADLTRTMPARMWAAATRGGMTRARWLSIAGAVLTMSTLAGWLVWRGRPHVPPAGATAWYERGALALRDGAYFRAAKALEQAVVLDPQFSLAHARLAEARAELDDAEGANREMLAALPTTTGESARGVAALYVDAIHRTLLRDFAGAVAAYQQLATQVQPPERAAVLVDIGRVREKNLEVAAATDAYREAIGVDQQNAAAHFRLAILLARGNRPESEQEFSRAEQLQQALGNPEGQADIRYRRGMIENDSNRTAEARRDLEQAIVLARAVGSEYREIAARIGLSVVTVKEGQLAQAAELASAAIEQARRAGFTEMVARGLIDLGNARSIKGDYAGAEEAYRESLDSARRSGMRNTEARALVSLASLHQQQGANDRTIQDIEPALRYFQQAGFQREEMACLILMARANRDLGKNTEALAGFERLVSLAEALKDNFQLGFAVDGIGTILSKQGRLPEALAYFERESNAFSKAGNRQYVGYGDTARAGTLWQLGRYDEAIQALKNAQEIAGPGVTNPLAASIIAIQARISLSLGKFREAVAAAKLVLEATAASEAARAETQCVSGLALAMTGARAEGRRICEEGRVKLRKAKATTSLAQANLLMSEILLATGAPLEALGPISEAIAVVDGDGNIEAGWRASALTARAYRLAGDRGHAEEAARKAATRLAELRATWGAASELYLQRPDVRALAKDIK